MTVENPEKLDGLTPHQLVSEIRQISEQYAAEVPGTRRNWPESLRARVLALARLGVARRRIAELCSLPPATVFLWCRALPRARRRNGHFIEFQPLAVPTVGLNQVSATVGLSRSDKQQIAAPETSKLTLRTPDGFQFEGFNSMSALVQCYRELLR